MAFADDYVSVHERVVAFLAQYPDGRIQTSIAHLSESLVVMMATVYRDASDTMPCIAHSQLGIPGKTNFTRDSEVENAETSAVGRALAFMGFETKRGISSRDEVRNKQRSDEAAFVGDSNELRPPATKPAEPRPTATRVTAEEPVKQAISETVQRFLDMKKLAVEQGIGIAYLVRALGGPSDQPAEAQSRWFAQSGALSFEAWLMTNPDKGIRDLVDRAGDYKRAAQPVTP